MQSEVVIHGDSLEKLKEIPNESVDLLCTDPPYGYSFMGKSWDKTLPDIGIFKECLRVLKPGAFAFVMSAPRSDVQYRMIELIEKAGFDVGFTPLYHTYASGFPKAMNIGKMVDKRNGAERQIVGMTKRGGATQFAEGGSGFATGDTAHTRGSSALEGSYGGFQPKPAVEVVIVAMKPLSEKTYVDQALKNGKGITWLDSVRIPTNESVGTHCNKRDENGKCLGHENAGRSTSGETIHADETDGTQGRFPANLLVEEEVLDDHSRFFSLDAWAQTLPFLAVPKASKSEKNAGLDELEHQKTNDGRQKEIDNAFQRGSTLRKNHHPTVKPLKLMSYLITLGSRPGDVVLDPFMGSGTTCVAAKELGRNFIGIEREAEYYEIAQARINAAKEPAPQLFAA